MLRIQSETGQMLQLEPNLSVELELNSWLLADSDDLPGSFSYPISFPLSDQNKRFLGHSHLPESRPREQKVSVWVNGIMLKQASLAYKIEKSGASGYLKIDAGEVASRIRGRYLHELFPEAYNFGSNASNLALLMKAAATAAPGVYPFTFFPVFNSIFAPTTIEKRPNYQYYDMINAWNGTSFLTNGTRHIVPFLYLVFVLERICQYFGFTATGSFLQHPEIASLVIYNTQTLRTSPTGVDPAIKQSLGLHLPYMTISDFLRALRDDFGLGIFFDLSKLECAFELYSQIRDSGPYADISRYVLKGYDNELPDDKGYMLRSYQDDEDGYYKAYEPVSYTIKEGEKEIKASIGTLQMQKRPNVEGAAREWLVPVANQMGNLRGDPYIDAPEYYNGVPKHRNSFGLRMLSYRGMQPDRGGVLYPLGSSTSRRYDQVKVGQWSLDAKQQDSVFAQLTVPYYDFLANARRLRFNLLLPLSLAKTMSLQTVYGIRGENRVLSKCLLESINISLPGKAGNVLAKTSVMILLPASATPNVYTGEVFYLEMFITNVYSSIDGDRTITYTDFKIRAWADSEKTVPANPTNLLVQYEEYNTTQAPGESTTNTINYYNFIMSGYEYSLTGLVTSDQSPAEQITIEYGLTSSADYVAL